jgi:DNA processing protein
MVVEAASRSGSLITAKAALDYGREVMAVPGHPFDARASGCNMLIRDGAVLVRGPQTCWRRLGATDRARPDPQEVPAGACRPRSAPAPAERSGAPSFHDSGAPRPQPLAEDQLMRDLNVTCRPSLRPSF